MPSIMLYKNLKPQKARQELLSLFPGIIFLPEHHFFVKNVSSSSEWLFELRLKGPNGLHKFVVHINSPGFAEGFVIFAVCIGPRS